MVEDLKSDDSDIENFLKSNCLTGKNLKELAFAHYNSPYKPPRKPYDFYCALVLTSALKTKSSDGYEGRVLFHSNVYGITFLSHQDTWEATRAEYMEAVKSESRHDDGDLVLDLMLINDIAT